MLNVRTTQEVIAGYIAGDVNSPLDELRSRINELPRKRMIAAYCQVGQRGYLATRILLQYGFTTKNFSGSYKTYRLFHPNAT